MPYHARLPNLYSDTHFGEWFLQKIILSNIFYKPFRVVAAAGVFVISFEYNGGGGGWCVCGYPFIPSGEIFIFMCSQFVNCS